MSLAPGPVARHYFGTDNLSWTGGTDDPLAAAVKRSFTPLSGAAKEKADSRKYIGVHSEWDDQAALTMGYKVSDQIAATLLS